MIEIKPHPGPQTLFHQSPAFELLYGGRAGGGKSFALIIEALRQVNKSGYSALLLRRSFPQLEGPGGLISISMPIYPSAHGSYNTSKHEWNFPEQVRILFRHLQNKSDHYNFQGHEYAFIGFDELSQFEEEQYRYLFSRCRVREGSGLRNYVRATSNPGAEWVKRRWAPWLDKRHPKPAKPGELRFYIADGDGEREVERGTADSWSRSFIPASYLDNPSLSEDYARNLDLLPYIERQRLKYGDWDILEGKGLILNREWFDEVATCPREYGMKSFRFWDLAATEKKNNSDDPDYTATCLLQTNWLETWITLDRTRSSWQNVKTWILSMAEKEKDVVVACEEEGGASGKALGDELALQFSKLGRTFHSIRPSGDKVARALPWAAEAERRKIHIVKNRLSLDEILAEFHGFPEWAHDDMIDATSGAWALSRRYAKKGSLFMDAEIA